MSETLIWRNLAAYSLQVGLLIGLAAFVPALLRLRLPDARLAYWRILLAASLLLPLVRPWQQDVVLGDVQVTSLVLSVRPAAASARPIPWMTIGLAVLIGGMIVRLIWLAIGFRRLHVLLRRSQPLEPAIAPGAAECRTSAEIPGPVTFGWRRPVILLPSSFTELNRGVQDAILCHELLHIERNDWLFTLAEELVRSILWFHPAIWWLLGEMQLAREQVVDSEVIARTQFRDEYIDALLAVAGHSTYSDVAPAPLFLRKRHLKQRVVSILKEVRMSRTAMLSRLAAGVGILAAACWFVTAAFPLSAAPQNDAAGVTVNLGGGAVLHRAPVNYPETARQRGVQGDVSLEVTMDSAGNVTDARVLSGPEELRRPALESVLQWHFTRESAGMTRQVTIGFHPTAETAASGTQQTAVTVQAQAGLQEIAGRTVKMIMFAGVPGDQQSELRAKLPLHEGDTLTPELIAQTNAAVKEYDEHLTVFMPASRDGSAMVIISMGNTRAAALLQNESASAKPAVPGRIRVGGNVQQSKLIAQTRPVYPLLAKTAGISGVVVLSAVIGKNGAVQELQVISGHPLLVPSALEAVKNWVYQPTLLNGDPVEVLTQIDVNYTLSQ